MEPLLKWVGSKRWQVDQLRGYVVNSRLVELFAGSAALSFGLEVEHAHLNDANPHLVNFYRQFVAGRVHDFSGATNEQEYYKRRDWFNKLIAEGKQDRWTAGLFYYLNSVGFNNLWRVNSRGEFNVPYRKGRNQVPPMGAMPSKHWTFSNDDFRDVVLEPDDFVYADPPYLGTFEGYTAEGFSEFDFVDLVALLSGHPGRVVITNSWEPLAVDTCRAAGMHVYQVESQQKMQHAQGREDHVSELLATNFPLTGTV